MRLGDRTAHLVRDGTVRRMPFTSRAQLDQMQRLAGVELEDVPDAEGEAECVRRLLDEAFAAQPRVFGARDVERTLVVSAEAGRDELVRDVRAQVRRQPLPLAREETVALQVAKGAVVGDDLEAVAQRLEAAPGTMAPVLARADQLPQEGGAV